MCYMCEFYCLEAWNRGMFWMVVWLAGLFALFGFAFGCCAFWFAFCFTLWVGFYSTLFYAADEEG